MAEARTNLYNPHEGLTGRDGGPYLDREEARLAEIRRAEIEGREPDLENPPATAGIPLVTARQLVQLAGANSVPSQSGYNPDADAIDKLAKDESFPVNPHSNRAASEQEVNQGRADAGENPVAGNPAHGAIASKDADLFDDKKSGKK